MYGTGYFRHLKANACCPTAALRWVFALGAKTDSSLVRLLPIVGGSSSIVLSRPYRKVSSLQPFACRTTQRCSLTFAIFHQSSRHRLLNLYPSVDFSPVHIYTGYLSQRRAHGVASFFRSSRSPVFFFLVTALLLIAKASFLFIVLITASTVDCDWPLPFRQNAATNNARRRF